METDLALVQYLVGTLLSWDRWDVCVTVKESALGEGYQGERQSGGSGPLVSIFTSERLSQRILVALE